MNKALKRKFGVNKIDGWRRDLLCNECGRRAGLHYGSKCPTIDSNTGKPFKQKPLRVDRTSIEIVENAIASNIDEIKKAYLVGKQQANYRQKFAGLNRAYEKLNELLPDNFRDNQSIGQAAYLNTKIRMLLSNCPELEQ